jgi:DNA-binding response OmpR family regulator
MPNNPNSFFMAHKVLIIDDDIVLNEMYSMKFTMEWFEVASAFRWQEGVDMIRTFKPDVVLLDIMMPWMSWLETVNVIKEEIDPKLKVIMFTNLNDTVNMDVAKMMWADDFLIKADTTPKSAVEAVRLMLQISRGSY